MLTPSCHVDRLTTSAFRSAFIPAPSGLSRFGKGDVVSAQDDAETQKRTTPSHQELPNKARSYREESSTRICHQCIREDRRDMVVYKTVIEKSESASTWTLNTLTLDYKMYSIVASW